MKRGDDLPARPLHVAHGIGIINRFAGGTSTFVGELASTQASLPGTRVSIITRDPEVDPVPIDQGVRVVAARSITGFGSALRSLHAIDPVDVIHVHGIWRWSIHDLIRSARNLGIPVVLSTHGMLQRDALNTKGLRKRLALWLFQRRDLAEAEMLHATADHEAARLREFGLRQPIVVAPPGLVPPPRSKLRAWDDDPPRTALFFSRIHPIKNLPGLVAAWSQVRPAGWRLVIAGPDTVGHAAEVRRAVENAGLSDVIDIIGPRFGDDKESLFRSASLFVLPSFSENFGIVAAEALSYGVPVITTTGTPWRSVVAEGCGWCVAPDAAALAAALREATARSSADLAAMGLLGRQHVESRCVWRSTASTLEDAYRQVVPRGHAVA